MAIQQLSEEQVRTWTRAQKDEWWFKNVFDPYIDKSTAIYEQIDYLTSRGVDASHLYNQLRDLHGAD